MLGALAVLCALFAYQLASTPAGPPTLSEYLSNKPGRTLAAAGYSVDGVPLACGKVDLVFDDGLDDVAAAHPGFIILNRKAFETLPKVVRLYAFGHECGHQVAGPDETKADCHAVTSGQIRRLAGRGRCLGHLWLLEVHRVRQGPPAGTGAVRGDAGLFRRALMVGSGSGPFAARPPPQWCALRHTNESRKPMLTSACPSET